jgi:hypothetical protein
MLSYLNRGIDNHRHNTSQHLRLSQRFSEISSVSPTLVPDR